MKSMWGRVVNPWDCPPGAESMHRLVNISNIPVGTPWDTVHSLFPDAAFSFHHRFGQQALIQFDNSEMAQEFVAKYRGKLILNGCPLNVSLSRLPSIIPVPEQHDWVIPQSRVICIQVVKLRVYLGIHDIYDECSRFGTVEKIICFEKTGKFALVQMATVYEASLVLVNLSNNPRHLPAFQMRIQYSKNHDIVIKFNNSKSFDFTSPDAVAQFAQLREMSAGESPFFDPEHIDDLPTVFDAWRPIHSDAAFARVVCVVGYDELGCSECDHYRNLFGQYGSVSRVRLSSRSRNLAYVTMANGFDARLVVVMLENWATSTMFVSLDHSITPELTSITSDITKDYEPGEELDVAEYGTMWYPSPFVSVRPDAIPLDALPLSDCTSITDHLLEFQSIEAAALFIATHNFARIRDTTLLLRFAKPPNTN